MGIGVRDRKLLWGRAGNRCAFPKCNQQLIVESQGAKRGAALIGREAHIVAQQDDGPRANKQLPQVERDAYPNLILLCPTHHDLVDSDTATYTVGILDGMKAAHEIAVGPAIDALALQQDAAWGSLVDEFVERIDLARWELRMSGLVSTVYGAHLSTLDALQEVGVWLNGRVYPQTHSRLRRAFDTFQAVSIDFYDVFSLHADQNQLPAEDPWVVTLKFYKNRYPNPNYSQDLERFTEHVNLVCDLAMELTRAANWICDQVRDGLDPTFFLDIGALQVEGGPYSDGRTRWWRPEYSTAEREMASPYASLETFKKQRYERDVHTPIPET